jgi:uncharacterized membrane protein YfcA
LGTIKNRIGTSLFMLLPPIGLFAAMKFYKEKNVDIFAALYMGLIFTIFASFSTNITLKLNINILKKYLDYLQYYLEYIYFLVNNFFK